MYKITLSVGQEEMNKAEQQPIVYPNPSAEYIVFTGLEKTEFYQLKLFNLQGQVMLLKEISNEERIEISHLKAGVYFYELIIENQSFEGKLLIN